MQQGCPLASTAFALVIKLFVDQLTHSGLSAKMFFHDDGFLRRTPEALAWAAEFFDKMKPISGLKMKWVKTECHAPGVEVARRCRSLLPKEVVFHDCMDFKFLKAPSGSDDFVIGNLKVKLEELRSQITLISKIPFLHKALTLLKYCTSICKVNHWLRTVPPKQLSHFVFGFDKILREGFESLLGMQLTDKWWRVAQLPAKYGSFGLRSGRNAPEHNI